MLFPLWIFFFNMTKKCLLDSFHISVLKLADMFLSFSLSLALFLSVCLLCCDNMLFGHCSKRRRCPCEVCHRRESICLSLKCLSVTKASVCLRFPIIKVPVCHYRIYCLSMGLSVICFYTENNIAAGWQWGCMVEGGHWEIYEEVILFNPLFSNL